MIWSDEPDDACVEEADLRGRRALEEGVAMMAALGDQPGPWSVVPRSECCQRCSYQRRCGYRVGVRALHMGWVDAQGERRVRRGGVLAD
jgi:hypothetical protein